MVNIATGLATLEPELEDVLRVLGAKRWDVLMKVGLPRSMPYFYGSLKVAITLAFVGTTVSGDDGRQRRHRLPADLGRLGHADVRLAFAGLVVVGAMAMAMYELFAMARPSSPSKATSRRHTTGTWAHRGSQNEHRLHARDQRLRAGEVRGLGQPVDEVHGDEILRHLRFSSSRIFAPPDSLDPMVSCPRCRRATSATRCSPSPAPRPRGTSR
jgi:hypothetical protein